MSPADPTLLAWAGIGFIGAFGLWKVGAHALHARRAQHAPRATA